MDEPVKAMDAQAKTTVGGMTTAFLVAELIRELRAAGVLDDAATDRIFDRVDDALSGLLKADWHATTLAGLRLKATAPPGG